MIMVTDDVLQETVKTLEECGGNQTCVGEKLGLARSTVYNRLARAGQRGMLGGNLGPPVPFGQLIYGTSTLVSGRGRPKLQWIKTGADARTGITIEAIREAFGTVPKSPRIALFNSKVGLEAGLMTVYVVADHHFGMYAWHRETGASYDIEIAEKLLEENMHRMVSRTPRSHTAVILNLGDFFHSDSNENRTRRSGAILDVDTRYARVLKHGVRMLVGVTLLALKKHKRVIVRNLQGNHDPYAALALTVAMKNYFHNNPRVLIEEDPSPFFHYRWGSTFIAATHGDMFRPSTFPQVMAANWPEDWGIATHRYGYMGHYHRQQSGESAGAKWEIFETLAPKDAWSYSKGFVSGRSMVAITHSESEGEVVRHTINIGGSNEARK